MTMIIRNNIRYACGGPGDNIVKITQAEYDALPESKNSNGILYAITDGEPSSGSVKPVEITQEEYDALGESVNTDGILYAITNGEDLTAKNLEYDGSVTELGITVQDAIDTLKSKLLDVSEYHDITVDSSIGTASNSWYRKVGTDVEMYIDVTITTINTQVVLFNLPEGYRPSRHFIKEVCPFNSTGGINYLMYNTSGNIGAYVTNEGTRIIEYIKISTL